MELSQIKMCLSKRELSEVHDLINAHRDLMDELDTWIIFMYDAIDDCRIVRADAIQLLHKTKSGLTELFMDTIPAPDELNDGGGEDDAPCSCLEGRT